MFQIRAATGRDLALLQSWAPHSLWETMSPQERAMARPELIAAHTREMLHMLAAAPQHGLALVAESAGGPVGYIMGGISPDSSTGEPQGFLLDLFVVPAARRHGVGRALWQAAEQQFARLGLRKVKMWGGLHNQVAMKMATNAGYKPEGLIEMKQW